MYMNVQEFRSNLKKHFDRAVAGDTVQIERGGIVFNLQTSGYVADGRIDNSVVVKETKKVARPLTRPPLVEDGDDPTDLETHKTPVIKLCKHGKPPTFCKFARPGKPCK